MERRGDVRDIIEKRQIGNKLSSVIKLSRHKLEVAGGTRDEFENQKSKMIF